MVQFPIDFSIGLKGQLKHSLFFFSRRALLLIRLSIEESRKGMLENKMSCLPTRVTERSSTLIDLFFCTSSFPTKIIKNLVSDQFGFHFFQIC